MLFNLANTSIDAILGCNLYLSPHFVLIRTHTYFNIICIENEVLVPLIFCEVIMFLNYIMLLYLYRSNNTRWKKHSSQVSIGGGAF